MKFSRAYHAALLTLGISLSITSIADDDQSLIRKYSFSSLERFWNNAVATSNQPNATVIQDILLTSDQGSSDPWDPIGDIWLDNNTVGDRYVFNVQRIPAQHIAEFNRREVALEMYLNREAFYEPPTASTPFETIKLRRTTIPAEKRKLDSRRASAAAELHLIKMIQYVHANTLTDKCSKLQQAIHYGDLYGSLGAYSIQSSESRWQALNAVVQSVSAQFSDALSNQTVCKVRAVSTRQETTQEIEQIVNAKISESLENQRTLTIDPINDTQNAFEIALTQATSIDPKTQSLLELERNMEAASANVRFVYNDSFNVNGNNDGILQQLDEIDASRIQSINAIPSPVQNTMDAQQSLQLSVADFLGRLSKFYESAHPSQRAALASCNHLDTLYHQVIPAPLTENDSVPSNYPGINGGALLNQFSNCLTATEAYLSNIGQAEPREKMVNLFAIYLQSLSDQILQLKGN